MKIKLPTFRECRGKIFGLFIKHRFLILALVISGTFLDTLSPSPSYDSVILFLVVLWVLVILLFKLRGGVFIRGALILLIVCPFLVILEKEIIAEKTAIWVYVFLVIGTAQRFFGFIKLRRRRD